MCKASTPNYPDPAPPPEPEPRIENAFGISYNLNKEEDLAQYQHDASKRGMVVNADGSLSPRPGAGDAVSRTQATKTASRDTEASTGGATRRPGTNTAATNPTTILGGTQDDTKKKTLLGA